MAAKSESEIIVHFAGLEPAEQVPAAALYIIGDDGVPDKKLGSVVNGKLKLEGTPREGAHVAIGPDVKTPANINPESLLRYRFDDVIDVWRERGILLPKDRWTWLLSEIVCVSGSVRKCRPWWYDLIAAPATTLSQRSFTQRSLVQQLTPVQGYAELLFPRWCVPLCDGIVEVWERKCCCHHPYIDIDRLLDRLRDLLREVPIEIDWPVPPEPEPWGPVLDNSGRVALNPQPLPPKALYDARLTARSVSAAKTFDPGKTYVSDRIYEDYQALIAMPRAGATAYLEARPYLYAYYCHCTMKKVGQVAIQPDGEFDFCYWRPRQFHHHHHHCHTTYAYRVKQLINGIWTVVYNGVAGQDYYGHGERAEIRTTSPKARPCSAGPKPPHEGDGTPFVILQNVGGGSTKHFNFPTQTDVSRVAPLVPMPPPMPDNAGLYDFGGEQDCPWATTLSFRLWSSPLLKGKVVYYRLKVAKVDNSGQLISAFQTLQGGVPWQRYDGTQATTEDLAAAPSDVGNQEGLYKFPYEGDGKNWFWVDYHQNWNTALFDPNPGAAETIENAKFMVVLEVFGPGGVRIKPNGAAGPGNAEAFQFRRWIDADDTANVPFADCAHIFWVNNRAVVADIANLKNGSVPNSGECQFMSGDSNSTFSVEFSAYHADGVTTGGGASDTNSFLRSWGISWQRGLNGPSGTLDSGTTDRGEPTPVGSASLTFGYLLGAHLVGGNVMGPHRKCTFSTTLNVVGKHHNGGSFLYGPNFYKTETAAFALEIG